MFDGEVRLAARLWSRVSASLDEYRLTPATIAWNGTMMTGAVDNKDRGRWSGLVAPLRSAPVGVWLATGAFRGARADG